MRSLFIKIFLWFWVAVLAMGAALVLAQRHWHTGPALPTPSAMAAYAAEAERLLSAGNRRALGRWLGELNRESELHFLLLDAEGRSALGHRLPPQLRERLQGRIEAGPPRLREPRLAVETLTVADRRYHLVALLPRHHRLQATPWWLRLTIALAVSGLVCLLLAGYLSRPIRRVRRAAQRLAAGDLQARVPAQRGGDELAELGRDFNAMAARLQQLLEAQSQLLRDVSHELRSPLNRLQVALELARGKAGPGAGESLARIELEAERLNELIGQVLALSRLEAGAVSPRWTRLDLAALLREVCEDSAFETGDETAVHYAGNARELVWADPGLLRSALENVVRNAVRHAGGAPVEVGLAGQGEVLTVSVRDHGEGVPTAELERIFEPFVRVSAARERASGGHGLGLAIARRALRLHGGEIRAENADGGGLRVSLRLPRRPAGADGD